MQREREQTGNVNKNSEKVVPHSESGIVPRSSLLGAGQLGFWEFGESGTIG
jgi:hypothetical protein